MEKSGGSRLLQMQARFQQKQLQERELKIASLYEAQQARALDRVRHSPGNGVSASPPSQSTPPVPHQPGKVRQMFEERRTKAGIDKSYPLQPIQNTERTQRKTLPNGYNKVTNTSKTTVEKKTTKSHTSINSHSVKKQNVTKVQKVDNLVNGAGDLNHNHEIDLSAVKGVPYNNGDLNPVDDVDNENYLLENETFPESMAPLPTPRGTEEPKRPPRRNPPKEEVKSPAKSKHQPPAAASPRRVAEKVPETKAKGAMQRNSNPIVRKTPLRSPQASIASKQEASAEEDACAVCGRHFASDRLAKHQDICRKTHAKKRKPFDVLKHRLAGTEAEPFINKLRKSTTSTSSTKLKKPLNSSWRQKHEEFISAIRAAKQVQAHLNAGGKLSDLPPPPPSENPDYVPCPHCGRRFNQGAADRHIPKCANFQFNKPKPAKRR